jgi:hypothetical protein
MELVRIWVVVYRNLHCIRFFSWASSALGSKVIKNIGGVQQSMLNAMEQTAGKKSRQPMTV